MGWCWTLSTQRGDSNSHTENKSRWCLTALLEAENRSGELFGFDRTREISGKSAREIADAAKAWGQNDDITVVTVRRAG